MSSRKSVSTIELPTLVMNRFMAIFARYGGEMLAVDETPVTLEGQWEHTRTVIIRFESSTDARAWYDSDAYQELAKHRWEGSTADIAIVAGLPPEVSQ